MTRSSVSIPRHRISSYDRWAKRGIGTAFKYLSFYKYTEIPDPEEMQRKLMRDWSRLALGRVYVASGTINYLINMNNYLNILYRGHQRTGSVTGIEFEGI